MRQACPQTKIQRLVSRVHWVQRLCCPRCSGMRCSGMKMLEPDGRVLGVLSECVLLSSSSLSSTPHPRIRACLWRLEVGIVYDGVGAAASCAAAPRRCCPPRSCQPARYSSTASSGKPRRAAGRARFLLLGYRTICPLPGVCGCVLCGVQIHSICTLTRMSLYIVCACHPLDLVRLCPCLLETRTRTGGVNHASLRVVLVRVVLVSKRCELTPVGMGMVSSIVAFAAYATNSSVVTLEYARGGLTEMPKLARSALHASGPKNSPPFLG